MGAWFSLSGVLIASKQSCGQGLGDTELQGQYIKASGTGFGHFSRKRTKARQSILICIDHYFHCIFLEIKVIITIY